MKTYESIEPTRAELDKRHGKEYFVFIAPSDLGSFSDEAMQSIEEGIRPPRVAGIPVDIYLIERKYTTGHIDISDRFLLKLRDFKDLDR